MAMMDSSRIAEHMEVVGSDGRHVGTVDKVEPDGIKLTRSDPGSGGHHHMIPMDWVASVDASVCLNKSAENAMNEWPHGD